MVGGPDPEVMAAIERGNAVVFLDVVLGEGTNFVELGRIKLELFVKDVSFCSFGWGSDSDTRRVETTVQKRKMSSESHILIPVFVCFVVVLLLRSVPKHVRIFDNYVQENSYRMNNRRDIRIVSSIV